MTDLAHLVDCQQLNLHTLMFPLRSSVFIFGKYVWTNSGGGLTDGFVSKRLNCFISHKKFSYKKRYCHISKYDIG